MNTEQVFYSYSTHCILAKGCGRVYSPEAVVRALRRLWWQGCTRAATTTSRPVDAGFNFTLVMLRGNASSCRHSVSHGWPNKARIRPRAARPCLPSRRASLPRVLPERRFRHFSRRFTRSIHALSGIYECFSHPSEHAQRLFGSKNEQDEENAHS